MSKQQQLLDELIQTLPAPWHGAIGELAENILQADAPMRLVLVGAFSVGKSSFLNMLLGEHLLQTALEETTALPTFIEYGEQRAMQLVGHDGGTLPLDEEGFSRATTQAPENAACAVLTLPLEWLKGLSIIDLPGLGSLLAANQAYTSAQIQQADVVLYLIDPRGPTQSDLKTITTIRQHGKRVKVMVTRWDEVEAAVSRGEKAPSLEQWAAQIEAGAGIKVRLAPCHRNGLGRDEALDFLQRAREDLSNIRLRRFRAELKPILENALGQNADAQRSCETASEEAAQTLHRELMQRKQALSEFKAGLYQQQQQDRDSVEQQCQTVQTQTRSHLASDLKQQAKQLHNESDWDEFGARGTQRLQAALTEVAGQFSHLSSSYGQLNLPVAQVIKFNLRLPAPEIVDVNDFLDIAKIGQVQQKLENCQGEIAAVESKLATLSVQDLSESEQVLHQLLLQRRQIAAQPLPRIMQQVENPGGGATMGRFIGEIADIGLMFLNPTLVGTKVAALVGKGAKVANIAVKTQKVASNISRGVKVAQAIQSGRRVPSAPEPAMDKLKMLEVLSLGYWGERIGAALGGQPQEEEIIDPTAQAEQAQALAIIEAQIQTLRRDLARNEDIANERQLTGWALEQNRKEQERLQIDLARRTQQIEQKRRDAQESARQERHELLVRHADRAVAQWLRSFDQQNGSMAELMRARIKSYWEDRVEALVDERMVEIDALRAQAEAGPQEKKETLARLQVEAAGMTHAMELAQ